MQAKLLTQITLTIKTSLGHFIILLDETKWKGALNEL